MSSDSGSRGWVRGGDDPEYPLLGFDEFEASALLKEVIGIVKAQQIKRSASRSCGQD